MIQGSTATKHRFINNDHPSMWVEWKQDDCGPDRWVGEIKMWRNGNEALAGDREYSVSVGQGRPLGNINFELNPCGYGALRFGHFAGTGVSERDLQWAGEWALAIIKSIDSKVQKACAREQA